MAFVVVQVDRSSELGPFTYERAALSFSIDTMRSRTSTITTTGISKVSPNAMNIVSTNDRYLSMSVIICTPAGA